MKKLRKQYSTVVGSVFDPLGGWKSLTRKQETEHELAPLASSTVMYCRKILLVVIGYLVGLSTLHFSSSGTANWHHVFTS